VVTQRQIATAVIPAAGIGTRMLPAAKAVPKELLPILDRPTIQYVVEEAAAAGIEEAILITSPAKAAIESHFLRDVLLETRLERSGRSGLLEALNRLIEQVEIRFTHQSHQRGLGHAVGCARDYVGNHPFLCLLGDTIFSGQPGPARQLVDAFRDLKTAIIGLEEVPLEKVSRYGIVAGPIVADGLIRVEKLVEKPSPDTAPSRYAIAARYLLTPPVFDCIDRTPPGAGGEVQLTDALQMLLQREPIHGVVLRARRHDIGNPLDWLRTNLLFALSDPQLRPQLMPMLKDLAE
jgi:UTP--glucose-1-phosphate uridylyltransferase